MKSIILIILCLCLTGLTGCSANWSKARIEKEQLAEMENQTVELTRIATALEKLVDLQK